MSSTLLQLRQLFIHYSKIHRGILAPYIIIWVTVYLFLFYYEYILVKQVFFHASGPLSVLVSQDECTSIRRCNLWNTQLSGFKGVCKQLNRISFALRMANSWFTLTISAGVGYTWLREKREKSLVSGTVRTPAETPQLLLYVNMCVLGRNTAACVRWNRLARSSSVFHSAQKHTHHTD